MGKWGKEANTKLFPMPSPLPEENRKGLAWQREMRLNEVYGVESNIYKGWSTGLAATGTKV